MVGLVFLNVLIYLSIILINTIIQAFVVFYDTVNLVIVWRFLNILPIKFITILFNIFGFVVLVCWYVNLGIVNLVLRGVLLLKILFTV